MADYIERQAALTVFQKVCDLCMTLVQTPMCGDCSVADTVRKVKHIPPADVRPVVRGHWEGVQPEVWDTMYATCSCCRKRMYLSKDSLNYCPNCGADMMGGDAE